ncbi:hypothetical protein VC279_20680 [Xanthomonas sp. WHRI 10064A]|uniref:hypothetical protein n=1 Tax=unclassified Xanthomonas TaxID=2643310 RepID=UPI002B22E075|nr:MULTISPECIES: hypothetical protein [unclassified Xanthomonas]MEA9589630.1 hypothetical protein [Xanthomonas sp. WHRI 10064B]MEA9617019.1 hypothetical protein [Xanthomonas sp. WHRI 10064A]
MVGSYAVQLHFDGDIASDHMVSMRTLGKTLSHLQNAVDRACLEINYGALWKHSKMPQKLWPDAELLVGPSYNGGYIIDFVKKSDRVKAAIERVNLALKTAVEKMTSEGINRTQALAEEVAQRRAQITSGLVKPSTHSELLRTGDPKIIRTYGDRAIVREIDQILAIIRSKASGESSFEMTLATKEPIRYTFGRDEAVAFHQVVSRREIGQPVIYQARIRSLDRISKTAKITNLEADRQSNLYFGSEGALLSLIRPFEKNEVIEFYGAPWIEYGAFDPGAGDILFIALVRDLGEM